MKQKKIQKNKISLNMIRFSILVINTLSEIVCINKIKKKLDSIKKLFQEGTII